MGKCGTPYNYIGHNPLPSCIKLGESTIHGTGLIANKCIDKWLIIGVSHIKTEEKGIEPLQRTVIGSFINHSDTPNCTLTVKGVCYLLCAIKTIREGEELTLDYSQELCGQEKAI